MNKQIQEVCNQCKLENNKGVCNKTECANYPTKPKEQELGFFEKVTASFIINKYPNYSLQTFLSEISTNKKLRDEFNDYTNKEFSQAIKTERNRIVEIVKTKWEEKYGDENMEYSEEKEFFDEILKALENNES